MQPEKTNLVVELVGELKGLNTKKSHSEISKRRQKIGTEKKNEKK